MTLIFLRFSLQIVGYISDKDIELDIIILYFTTC